MQKRICRIVTVVGLSGLLAIPFFYSTVSVKADEYGTQESEESEDTSSRETTEREKEAASIAERDAFERGINNNPNVSSINIGTSTYTGGSAIGGGIANIFAGNQNYAQKADAVGCVASNGEVPYTKVDTEVGPVARGVIMAAATSKGYIPGGIFNVEIGKYRGGQITISDSLSNTINLDIYVNPAPAGYTRGIMALLPDGSTKLIGVDNKLALAGYERTYADMDGDGIEDPNWMETGNIEGLVTLRTPYPKAVYMMVYIPE